MRLSGSVERTLSELYASFGERPPEARRVEAGEVPEPQRGLLDHSHHMTVTLEEHHGCPVTLEVLARSRQGDRYTRRILLRRSADGSVVMYGIMQFDFRFCTATVRDRILRESTPLGRLLLEEGVLTEVGKHGLYAIEPSAEIAAGFGHGGDDAPTVYGRTAIIFCDGEPAVDLLEIVAPLHRASPPSAS